MVDLNDVRMFVQVVRARSFAEAARRLGVPPNTLSRRIRELESGLDTRLMQRSTRKLTLTAAGQAFFDRCAPAVDGVVEAGRDLVDGSDTPSGSVRVAAPADFLDFFSIAWVAEFLNKHPRVRLDFVLNDARADLFDEDIDVAFRGGSSRDMRSVFRQITSQHFNLVASPDYLAARGHPKTLQELAQHDCLIVSTRQSRVTWTLQGPGGEEDVEVSGRFNANSARILMKACLSGLGVALLPVMMVSADLRAGRLVHVLQDYRRDGADLNIVLPSRQHIPTAVSAFVEFALLKLQSITTCEVETASGSPNRRKTRLARRPPAVGARFVV
jgi:DNA-binding transcriptional LysR family regulator